MLPPLAPRPSRRRTPPRPPPPPLRLPLLRLSVSSSRGELRYSRKAHVSARIAVACTRRYASSSTFVTSQPPRTLRLLLAAAPPSRCLSLPPISPPPPPPLFLPRRGYRRRHLSFASLLISERSCRWWSRHFRESFLEASTLPFLALLAVLCSSCSSCSSSSTAATHHPFFSLYPYLIFVLRREKVLKREPTVEVRRRVEEAEE